MSAPSRALKSSSLVPADLIRLPYTPDLTRAGIAYACRSLPYTYDRMGGSPFDRLRRIVVGVAVEVAFRRLLGERRIPHDTLGTTPFTDPDRYDIALGGRRCDLKSFLIFNKREIRKLRRHPSGLLQASALVPADQMGPVGDGDEDLFIFAFVNALVTRQRPDLERAIAAGQPTFLIHPLPAAWARPKEWVSLAPLSLKSEGPAPFEVKLGGQGADRQFLCEALSLPPRTSVRAGQDFHSLAYLHIPEIPAGRIGLHSPRQGPAHLVGSGEWGNIWVYGMEIILAGYLPRGEFRHKGHVLPAGSRVLQYPRTRTKNVALAVAELRPLSDLFQRVRKWDGGR